jgi:hypothetical protein
MFTQKYIACVTLPAWGASDRRQSNQANPSAAVNRIIMPAELPAAPAVAASRHLVDVASPVSLVVVALAGGSCAHSGASGSVDTVTACLQVPNSKHVTAPLLYPSLHEEAMVNAIRSQ